MSFAVHRGLGTRCRFRKRREIRACPPAWPLTLPGPRLAALGVLVVMSPPSLAVRISRRLPSLACLRPGLDSSPRWSRGEASTLAMTRHGQGFAAVLSHLATDCAPSSGGRAGHVALRSEGPSGPLDDNPGLVSPDGFRVSRPVRRDIADAPPPLGGHTRTGHLTRETVRITWTRPRTRPGRAR